MRWSAAVTFAAVELLYEYVPDTLSQLIRTAFIPRDGAQFYVADFSAIEARVIAWYADESWRQKVFEQGGDIYCASASQMFKVPVEKHGINGHLRQKGKIAELALGYGGSVGALKAMGAIEMGLTEDELPPLVDAWRQANPKIVEFWRAVDRAVMEAVKYKHTSSHFRADLLLQKRHAVYHAPFRQKAGLCETEGRYKQIWRRMYHLRRRRCHKKVGTPRFLWSEVCGKHRAGHSQRYPLLRHADAAPLLHRYACA